MNPSKYSHLQSTIAHVESIGARLPAKPATQIRHLINRTIESLPRLTRGNYLTVGLVAIFVGLGFLIAGAATADTALALVGAFCVVSAAFVLVMVKTFIVESAISSVIQQADARTHAYRAEIERFLAELTPAHRARINSAIDAAVTAGAKLDHIREESTNVLSKLRDRVAALTARRDSLATELSRRESEFRKTREQQSVFARRFKARFLPWVVRRDARAVLLALANLHEAAGDLAEANAIVTAWGDFETSIVALGHPPKVTAAHAEQQSSEPCWRGIIVPEIGEIEAPAVTVAQAKLMDVRGSVLQSIAKNVPSEKAVADAAEELFAHSTPWPNNLPAYIASRNGSLPALVETLVASGAEWLPTNRVPGRRRDRRVFLFARGAASSPLYAAVRERLPDIAGVIPIENPESEVLFLAHEQGLAIQEVPEALACIQSFRKAAPERQERILALLDPSDVAGYFPERGNTPEAGLDLLSMALSLGCVVRAKDQTYRFGKRIFAKGFDEAVNVLFKDQRLAAEVSTAVTELRTASGVTVVITRLETAKTEASAHVPNEAREAFVESLETTIRELRSA